MLRSVLSIIALLFISFSFAQSGKVTGKITNNRNEALAGVSIKIAGTAGGAQSGVDGTYTISLPAGKVVELTFSYVGYQAKNIAAVQVKAGEVLNLDVLLETATNASADVVVTGRARVTTTARGESVNALIAYQKNTNTVASVISAEAVRRSPDRNTGEVLKRTPGASLQDGKFLIVRGLSDRYNLAMLNGVPLSSTEPDRKTFSFDLIPAPMIDNIVINKAFVPELPGEWAGGLIQVNTKDIPTKNYFNIQIGTGFNTQSISHDFYSYSGGKLDWLGIDDGYRKLPAPYTTKNQFNDENVTNQATKNNVAKNMKNVWNGHTIGLPINQQFQANGGFTKNIFKNKTLGGVFGVTYNRQARYQMNETNDNDVDNGRYNQRIAYNDDRYSQDVLWGALGNLSLRLNNNNTISAKALFNVNSTKYIINRSGIENFSRTPFDSVKAYELVFRENMFLNTQLTGDHNLFNNKIKFHWFGSFNVLSGYQPDQRRLMYTKDNTVSNAPYIALITNTLSQRTGSRLYQNLSDYIYTAGGDATYGFNWLGQRQSVKGGYLFQVKDRLFNADFFSTEFDASTGNSSLLLLPPGQIFNPANYGNGNFNFNMIKGDNYRYLANTILNAGFIQFDNQFGKKFRAVWGVRAENYDQLVGSVFANSDKHSSTEVLDFLPGVNLTYKLNNQTNIRLAGSQTVVRPEFRELANFTFYDFELNGTVVGNKLLERTKATNAEIRYELYPKAGEMFTIGFFYKYFSKPIFQRLNYVAGRNFSFENADNGYTFGPEVEIRKRLDFITPKLKNLIFQANLAYIESNMKQTNPLNGQNLFDAAFQGQSKYLINTGLWYDLSDKGLSATLLYNQVGRRIAFYGDDGNSQPAIWEGTRPVFDFQIAKKVMKGKGEFRMNVSDIFNKRLYFYQNVDSKESFNKNVDATVFSRKYGTNFSFTFGYSL